ncbi:hypothetical protein OG21DRAFT_1489164 [Imleria badia]|nr:hypothetical protein OG21DRAFT_1489164 [Imleria badia]
MGALDNTFGAFLIGVVVSATLYGVTCIQTWYYYGRYPSDPWYVKLLVSLREFALSVPSQSCATGRGRSCVGHLPPGLDHAHGQVQSSTAGTRIHPSLVYTYLVTDFGGAEALGEIVWSLIIEVFFNGFTALFVQSFLAMRVYRLSNKSWLATGSVMSLVIGEFVLIVVYGVKALHLHTFAQLATLKALSMSVNAVAAAGDVLIAALLCTLLQRSRTGFRRSDTMINKLIVFSINTGLLTSVCAVASLISIAAWPDTFVYIAFYFCLGRLYCNSLLATLNARKGLRGESRSDETSLSLQGVHQKTTQSMIATTSKRSPNNISIKIDTTQEYVRDEQYSASSRDVKSPVAV